MTPANPTPAAKGLPVFLGVVGLAALGYFVFLHPRIPTPDDLHGGWACDSKPWNLRFDKAGDLAMQTIGPAQRGSYRIDAEGNLFIDMADGKHYKAKAAIRNGSLILTDPDGTASTFKRSDAILLPEPDPVPPPVSIHGRWVSTEAANEVIELTPQGAVKVTNRGDSFPTTGRYRYANGVLRYDLDRQHGVRTVENRVTSLTDGEMTIFLPALTGVREARSVTFWRIDPADYPPARAKLLGKWEGTGRDRELVEFGTDDTMRVSLNGQQYAGIFRVAGNTLEYHLNVPNSAAITRMTVESVTDTEHALVSPFNGKRAAYRRTQ